MYDCEYTANECQRWDGEFNQLQPDAGAQGVAEALRDLDSRLRNIEHALRLDTAPLRGGGRKMPVSWPENLTSL